RIAARLKVNREETPRKGDNAEALMSGYIGRAAKSSSAIMRESDQTEVTMCNFMYKKHKSF
ncbi:MAG: hypothetical protein QM645_01085, partial [Asticcacaulis sp.]